MKLCLYNISDEYLDHIRDIDSRVYDNKFDIGMFGRKYLGIVLDINGFNYFAPLSSPKKTDYDNKGNIRKSILPIIRIADNKNKLLGTIKLSNMVPVPLSEVSYYNVKIEEDARYKNLVLSELNFIKKNEALINNYAKTLYNQKCQKKISNGYLKNTLEFEALEAECEAFKKDFHKQTRCR